MERIHASNASTFLLIALAPAYSGFRRWLEAANLWSWRSWACVSRSDWRFSRQRGQHRLRAVRRPSNEKIYVDERGEDVGAPDITRVVVSNDDSGLITFRLITPNRHG